MFGLSKRGSQKLTCSRSLFFVRWFSSEQAEEDVNIYRATAALSIWVVCPKKDYCFHKENVLLTALGIFAFFRVHCFHYLIPLAKEGNYAIVANVESMDYDPLVVKLNKDISAIEEAMSASLQQHKFQYIFEGQILSVSLGFGEEGRVKGFVFFFFYSLLLKFTTCSCLGFVLVWLFLFGLKLQYLVSLHMAR